MGKGQGKCIYQALPQGALTKCEHIYQVPLPGAASMNGHGHKLEVPLREPLIKHECTMLVQGDMTAGKAVHVHNMAARPPIESEHMHNKAWCLDLTEGECTCGPNQMPKAHATNASGTITRQVACGQVGA